MMPTFLAAAGVPDVKEKLLTGYQADDNNFKVHLDGYNMMSFWNGTLKADPRKEIFYFDQGANLNAIRYQNWKLHFTILEGAINTAYRKQPAWPILINLRADPYETAWKESSMYIRWFADNMWTFVPAQAITEEFLKTFVEFPPVIGSSLGIDKILQKMISYPQN